MTVAGAPQQSPFGDGGGKGGVGGYGQPQVVMVPPGGKGAYGQHTVVVQQAPGGYGAPGQPQVVMAQPQQVVTQVVTTQGAAPGGFAPLPGQAPGAPGEIPQRGQVSMNTAANQTLEQVQAAQRAMFEERRRAEMETRNKVVDNTKDKDMRASGNDVDVKKAEEE